MKTSLVHKIATLVVGVLIVGTPIVKGMVITNDLYRKTIPSDTVIKVITSDSTKKEKNDTTRIILGKKEIKIIESEQGTDIKMITKPSEDSKDNKVEEKEFSLKDKESKNKKYDRFKGHWNGVNFGLNTFLNSDMSLSLTGSDEFMSVNTNPLRSTNFNVNFGQVNIGLIGKSVGLVSGLAFQFNNYFFENNNSIVKDVNGVIIEQDYSPIHLEKSKLAITYLTIPLLLELKLPHMGLDKRIWISGGILGSLKLNSHTKVVYHNNGERKKDKNRDDFNISALRYGLTARAGYGNFYVYGDYYPTPLFEKNKGPELYPISIGIGFGI